MEGVIPMYKYRYLKLWTITLMLFSLAFVVAWAAAYADAASAFI